MDTRRKYRTAFLRALVCLAAAAPALLAGCNAPPEVPAARVVREDFRAWVSSNGKVETIAPHVLRALVPARVDKVHAVEGQPVRPGQLLVELDGAEARAQLARAREDLLAAEERLRAARAGGPAEELARVESELRKTAAERDRLRRQVASLERLVERQAATRDELARARVELERAEAEHARLSTQKDELARTAGLDVERALHEVERARSEIRAWGEKVASTRILAPAGGTLYALPVRAGDFVRTGDLVAELADLARVRVRAFVDEPELGPLAEGQKTEINWDAAPGRVWHGRVENLPKQVVARGSRSVGEVLCSVDNTELGLLPNTNVSVRILVREQPGALVVPRAAVRGEGDARHVFVVENGRLEQRAVRVGAASAERYEIVEGLRDGEQVALPSDRPLSDGMAVRVKGSE